MRPPTPDWPAWTKLCGFFALPRYEHEPLPPKVEHFPAAARRVLATPAMKQHAVAVAARMQDDDGVGTAVRTIEEIA